MTTLFGTSTRLREPLIANGSDRFSDGQRRPYPNGRPIRKLRFLGEQDGRFFYAAADDVAATLPPPASAAFIANCRVAATRIENLPALGRGQNVTVRVAGKVVGP